MLESRNSGLIVEQLEDLAIVSLRVSHDGLAEATEQLRLAHAGAVSGGDPQSLCVGPGRWLLMSRSVASEAVVFLCEQGLANCVYSAVDYSSALTAFRVGGEIAEQVLASGTGVDLRPDQFPIDSCCRTLLAQIAAIVVAHSERQFDIYVDRSYAVYLTNWLAETSVVLANRSG